MKSRNIEICVAASVLALSFLAAGCDREVSKSTSTSVSRDGTVKSQETTVTESPGGTVTKTIESKTIETKTSEPGDK